MTASNDETFEADEQRFFRLQRLNREEVATVLMLEGSDKDQTRLAYEQHLASIRKAIADEKACLAPEPSL
jgi:hypothetical protein